MIWLQYDQDLQTVVRYKINGSAIQIAPWLFAVPTYSTFLVGYQRAGYPQNLQPVIVPIQISPFER